MTGIRQAPSSPGTQTVWLQTVLARVELARVELARVELARVEQRDRAAAFSRSQAMARPIFFPENEAAKVHHATLTVLQTTGIQLDHDEALELYLQHGATRDEFGRCLIPPAMVDEALEKSSAKIQLYDREGNKSLLLRNGRTFFGPGSDALYNIDKSTHEIRRSCLADVRENVRIADALSGYNFVMSMALPEDVPPDRLYVTTFAQMMANTTKPVIFTSTCLEDVKQIHAAASIVCPDLPRRPCIVAYLEPISPLRFDRSIVDRLLYCADNAIPVIFAAGANCGSGAPITPEGGVVQGGAESLAGLVLALLKNENARFIYGSNTSVMDMKTSIVSYGAPEWFRTVAMYADMGKYYGLPSWGTAGCSDSFDVDAQAAMEAYEGILMAIDAGTTVAHDVGYLAHGALYDARMLVLTDEMIKRARHLLKPVDLSERSLATDVIDEIARKNELYLAHPHTAEVFRDVLWLAPAYINRRNLVHESAARGLPELLGDRVDGILSTHEPTPLPPDTAARLESYLTTL